MISIECFITSSSNFRPKRYFKMYSTFLQNFSFTHIAILLLLFALLGSCIFMTMNMEENFVPEKTFDDNSFLARSFASMNKVGPVFCKTSNKLLFFKDSNDIDLSKLIFFSH